MVLKRTITTSVADKKIDCHSHFLGDEDCLYVNVYTPNLNPLKKLDVLVHIHGGAFMFNYGGQYGPQIILDRDVVYINFNYRLGPLGK